MRLTVRDERKQFTRQTHAYAEYRAFSRLAGADPPVEDVTVTLARSAPDGNGDEEDGRDDEDEGIVCTIAIRTGTGEIAEARAVARHACAAIDRAASLIRLAPTAAVGARHSLQSEMTSSK